LASGCGGAPHGEVLKFWAFGAEADQVSALLPAFEREHPGLHVEVQRLALTAAHEKFLTAVAGDATPDMCQLGNSWIPELVALHALEPLQSHVAASKIVEVADFSRRSGRPLASTACAWGVPWYVTP